MQVTAISSRTSRVVSRLSPPTSSPWSTCRPRLRRPWDSTPNRPESRGFPKQLLVALDAQNSKGGATLSAEGEWAFTGEPEFERDGVVYKFDQELKPGEFYVCVVGADGSDVTQASYPSHVRLTHADFATPRVCRPGERDRGPEGFWRRWRRS